MFPLKARDELVFAQPDNLIIDDDLILDPAFLQRVATGITTTAAPETQCQLQFGIHENKNDRSTDKNNIRRSIHRDLEKQRRQEMSQLYASLRSLLPIERIKGKRSISDHLQGAVNYIKHKQNHIEKLKIRRDELKKLTNVSATEIGSSNGSDKLPCNSVMVNLDQNGVEILVDSSDQFRLSRVLQELMVRELNVVSFVSTKVKERVLHKIQAEAVNPTSLDLSRFQERLTNLIN
ncbi:hypothetical protein BUALT_Bualt06G0120400 [Buddleja alternifolia]|uniref:BHLH domain-containing protein n=1 Tax=Buddleja alternifolia TaxID=168488 RepID=A0AAV6XN11_9LAMI|nr:hypothetical protein BUALT_Bualt06G0120400 [Buddleja alternifolia]